MYISTTGTPFSVITFAVKLFCSSVVNGGFTIIPSSGTVTTPSFTSTFTVTFLPAKSLLYPNADASSVITYSSVSFPGSCSTNCSIVADLSSFSNVFVPFNVIANSAPGNAPFAASILCNLTLYSIGFLIFTINVPFSISTSIYLLCSSLIEDGTLCGVVLYIFTFPFSSINVCTSIPSFNPNLSNTFTYGSSASNSLIVNFW